MPDNPTTRKRELKQSIGMMQGDLDVLEANGPSAFWCVSIGWDDGSRNKLNEDDLGREALNAIFAIAVNALKGRIIDQEQELAAIS